MRHVYLLPVAVLAAALPAPAAAQLTSISYETTACFGYCPIYRVTVNADGGGLFEGRRFSAFQGQRRFRISPAQFRAFAARLAPVRPARGDIVYDRETRCQGAGPPPTDHPSIIVTWIETRRRQTLHFYTGCRNPEILRALGEARGLLPIERLINPPRRDGGRG
jgi:hypothetical protein